MAQPEGKKNLAGPSIGPAIIPVQQNSTIHEKSADIEKLTADLKNLKDESMTKSKEFSIKGKIVFKIIIY
jgi:hypothetical protein